MTNKEILDMVDDLKNLKYEIKHFELDPNDYEEDFDGFINQTQDTVEVLSARFDPAYVLKECDPIAYHQNLLEYVNGIPLQDVPEYQEKCSEICSLEDDLIEIKNNQDLPEHIVNSIIEVLDIEDNRLLQYG